MGHLDLPAEVSAIDEVAWTFLGGQEGHRAAQREVQADADVIVLKVDQVWGGEGSFGGVSRRVGEETQQTGE
jgi:hypothetical protein